MALDSIRAALEFGVLGPLAVHHEGRVVLLAGAKERGVLAFLLLRANQVVPAERLIDSLWPGNGSDGITTGTFYLRLRKYLAAAGLPLLSCTIDGMAHLWRLVRMCHLEVRFCRTRVVYSGP